MPRDTPQDIVDALHEADAELRVIADQYAWFKGQKDHWKDLWDLAVARGTATDTGLATKAKAQAILKASNILVQIPWMSESDVIGLMQMVRLTEASFDLVAKRYNRLESHIMTLMAVNKNIMQDYARAGV